MNQSARTALMYNIQKANEATQLKAGVAPEAVKRIVFKDKNGKKIPNAQLRALGWSMGVTRKKQK